MEEQKSEDMQATLKKGCLILPFPNEINCSDFKPDFVWGSATSSYQIEGAAAEGGRGPSVWDAFTLKHPEAIVDGDNGNMGINAYHKIKEDVQTMKKMGLKAYRFSLSWSRILPGGKLCMGINQEGVDYYNNVINELIANDIEPYVTLWHWDTPNVLEGDYMGFLSDKIICDFMHYAEFCFWEFGDRVKHWITLNEPYTYAWGGYALGTFAPGRGGSQPLNATELLSSNNATSNLGVRYLCGKQTLNRVENVDPSNEDINRVGNVDPSNEDINKRGNGDPGKEPYIVAHNLILCHATAVKLYRERFQERQGGTIGITLNTIFFEPLDPKSSSDIAAAIRGTEFIFGWFMEPIFSGKYPDSMVKNVTGGRLPAFTEEQRKLVIGSYDFLGLNYYHSQYATSADPSTDPPSYLTDSMVHEQPDRNGVPIGPQGGPTWLYSYPPGLYKMLVRIKDSYGDPIVYVTENGWGTRTDTKLTIEEARVDDDRINYHNLHLQQLRDAIDGYGCRVKGYFAWSFMDNFEWVEGYSVRFGLIYVDYKGGKFTRYPKNSAIWFSNFLTYREKLKETKKRLASTSNTETTTTKRTRK